MHPPLTANEITNKKDNKIKVLWAVQTVNRSTSKMQHEDACNSVLLTSTSDVNSDTMDNGEAWVTSLTKTWKLYK